jgi:hypothetical protein
MKTCRKRRNTANTMPQLLLFVVLALVGFASSAAASETELVMLERAGCPACAVWNIEIGPIYPKTPEGKRAPLRRVDIDGPWPLDLQQLEATKYSPTFVLVHRGEEVARIVGYADEAFFWGFITKYLDDLTAAGQGAAP